MSLYNEDELKAPLWIDNEFLKMILTKCENNESVEIIKFDISPASMKGDHYASIMFRCKVSYEFANSNDIQQRSLIIKTLPVEEGKKREMLMESRLFETEIAMYTETLPKIEKILAEIGEPTRLKANIFYHSLKPHKVIILEDLCESGYDTVRNRYLTEDEIKAVYSKLAKLHAVSYMLGHSEDSEVVTKHQEGVFSISAPMLKEMISNGMQNFINMLKTHDEFGEYLEKATNMWDVIEQRCKDLYNAYALQNGSGDIFVLNHGDFHMKNIMFKFDKENHLEDMIMVDYQISCYAPSTIDLIYSQYLMLSPELRLKRHQLTQHYFTEFIKILKKINYPGTLPKYSEFQMAALKYRHFSVFLLAVMLPMVVGILSKPLEEFENTDMNEIFESPETIADIYNLPEFIDEVRKFMPILLSEGYLD